MSKKDIRLESRIKSFEDQVPDKLAQFLRHLAYDVRDLKNGTYKKNEEE